MKQHIGALTLILLLGMVFSRLLQMRRIGIRAMQFGKMDKKDFLIPPFTLFYFYVVFAVEFGFPVPSNQRFFQSPIAFRCGAFLCLAGLFLVFLSLISFGRSFRVGIDADLPDKLVTTGVFAFTRNPIYVAFALVLLGQFLLFSNWILLLYVVAGIWLFHRQVSREETYLKEHYGQPYVEYCRRVRRYL